MEQEKLEYIYRPLHEIKSLPGNAKLHDLEEIKASIRAHGFIDPIGVNPATLHDLDGNGRLQALKMMFADGETPPRKILTGDNGDIPCWLVPTVEVDIPEEDEAIVALRLNRSHDKGGYDKAAILAVLELAAAQQRLEQTGYDENEMSHLKMVVDHSNPETLDEFFREDPNKPAKEEKVKIVLEFAAGRAEQVRQALLEHGETFEEAVEALLGI